MAKKRIEIDLDDIRRLGALQCTEGEAAAFFHIATKKFKQIMQDFPEVKGAWEEGKESGKISLRRRQFRLASTSASMAIHLGKNILNQRDVVVNEVVDKGGQPFGDLDLTKLDGDARQQLRELLIRAKRPQSTS